MSGVETPMSGVETQIPMKAIRVILQADLLDGPKD
jgi:hypothetical protein